MHIRHLLAVVALLAACASDDDVVEDGYNIDIALNGRAMIPAGSADQQMLGDVAFSGFDEIAIPQRAGNRGDTDEEITSVRLVEVRLEILSGAPRLDFIDSIAFFVEAGGAERVEIAREDPFADGQVLHGATPLDVELRPFFAMAPSIRITAEATGLAPHEDATIAASLGFALDN